MVPSNRNPEARVPAITYLKPAESANAFCCMATSTKPATAVISTKINRLNRSRVMTMPFMPMIHIRNSNIDEACSLNSSIMYLAPNSAAVLTASSTNASASPKRRLIANGGWIPEVIISVAMPPPTSEYKWLALIMTKYARLAHIMRDANSGDLACIKGSRKPTPSATIIIFSGLRSSVTIFVPHNRQLKGNF